MYATFCTAPHPSRSSNSGTKWSQLEVPQAPRWIMIQEITVQDNSEDFEGHIDAYFGQGLAFPKDLYWNL